MVVAHALYELQTILDVVSTYAGCEPGAGALLGQVADLDADEEAQPDGEADDDDEFGATPRRRSSKKMSDVRILHLNTEGF